MPPILLPISEPCRLFTDLCIGAVDLDAVGLGNVQEFANAWKLYIPFNNIPYIHHDLFRINAKLYWLPRNSKNGFHSTSTSASCLDRTLKYTSFGGNAHIVAARNIFRIVYLMHVNTQTESSTRSCVFGFIALSNKIYHSVVGQTVGRETNLFTRINQIQTIFIYWFRIQTRYCYHLPMQMKSLHWHMTLDARVAYKRLMCVPENPHEIATTHESNLLIKSSMTMNFHTKRRVQSKRHIAIPMRIFNHDEKF